MEILKELFWLGGLILAWLTSYLTTKFETKKNSEQIKDILKDLKDIGTLVNELKNTSKEAISSKEAYASFVSKELLELHLKSLEQKIDGLVEIIKERR